VCPDWNAREQCCEQVGLRLLWRSQKARFCGCQLREDLSELTQLNDTGVRIILEIAFGQCGEAHKLRVVYAQKIKIRALSESDDFGNSLSSAGPAMTNKTSGTES
jgi:hypothetical protein